MACAPREREPEAPPLPAIHHQMRAILGCLKDHQVVVVSAAPGSGKSSVLPGHLASSGYGPVLCAQPRHFAAVVAAAKAGEAGDTSDVVFTTIRQLLDAFGKRAPILAEFSAFVIDEAHERTLGTDVLLGMVKAALATGGILRRRCRVVLCTAGGPADELLHEFFGEAPIVASTRAAHPVEVHYSRGPMLDMVSAVVEEVAAIHTSQPPGDVLVFLPEIAGIHQAHAKLQQLSLQGLVVSYIHDHLPEELRDTMLNAAVPDGSRSRRAVLATDVAETAVLVRGIKYVVDTGLLSEETPEMISKEAAVARAATAGISGPGHCFRLYQQDDYEGLDEHSIPHIRRDGGVDKFVLMVKRHAADSMPGFEVFDPELAPAAVENAVARLIAGGYLDKHGNLTHKGEREAYDED